MKRIKVNINYKKYEQKIQEKEKKVKRKLSLSSKQVKTILITNYCL